MSPTSDAMDHRQLLAAVNGFLDGFVRVCSLRAAFELGIIDRLADEGPATADDVTDRLDGLPRMVRDLLDQLVGHGVLCVRDDHYALSDTFRDVLRARDLLDVRIDYAARSYKALLNHYAGAVVGPNKGAKIPLYDYDHTPDVTERVRDEARPWVRYQSTLTRYQAPVVLDGLDLSGLRTGLEVGGNVGEYARQMCNAWPALRMTVIDIPVVCALGREHVGGDPAAERVAFQPLDFRKEPLPAPVDLVSFKSVLHDWPDEMATRLIGKAFDALRPGGRLVIAECHHYHLRDAPMPEHDAEILPFLECLRHPDFYVDALRDAGFDAPTVERLPDIQFMRIVTHKPT